MKLLLSSICLAALLWGLPCWAKEKPAAPDKPKELILVAIQKIARGTTMYDRRAKNVGFTINPTGASFTISF